MRRRRPAGRPGTDRPSLRGGASGGRAVRPVCHQSTGDDRRLGRTATTPTVPGTPCRTTWPGSHRCGGRCGTCVPAADPVHRVDAGAGRAGRRPGAAELPPRVSLFGLSRLPALHARVISALGECTATCICGCRIRPTRCGAPCEASRAPSGSAPDSSPAARSLRSHSGAGPPPAAGLVGPGVPGTAAGSAAGRHRLRPTRSADRPNGLLHGCNATSSPTGRPGAGGRRHRTTGASRCTPATGRPARSTCCARSSSVCCSGDPTLEPRDVLVLCPDIEQYAPLIAAGFGLAEVVDHGHPAHGLRVKLADRALRQTNGLLALAARLIDLAGSRFTATDVLDLAAAAGGASPVLLHRRRSGHDDRLGLRSRESAGDWTLPIAPSTSWRRFGRTPGGPDSIGSCSGSRWPKPSTTGWAWPCRWTTSGRPRSISPDDLPSSSTDSVRPSTGWSARARSTSG